MSEPSQAQIEAHPERIDGFNRLMITVSIMTATLMNALDMTIANVALPHIQGSVSASQDQVTWVLTSYIVAAAIMTPLTGAFTARFGQKRVFLVAVAGFTAASALCGIAQNLIQIVGFRLLQGMFGAPLIPLAQAVLLDINPPHKQGQAMAVWGMASMLGPIMGPALGGYLTDHFSWRWVFYINLPFGIASFVGISLFIKDAATKASKSFDLMGYAFLAVGVGAIQMMLDRGQQLDWFSSPEIWTETVIGVGGLYLCVVQTLTAKAPFIKREVVFNRNFITACLFSLFMGVLMFATTALLPPMLETLLGYPVTQAGFLLAPRGVGTLISMFFVGRLVGADSLACPRSGDQGGAGGQSQPSGGQGLPRGGHSGGRCGARHDPTRDRCERQPATGPPQPGQLRLFGRPVSQQPAFFPLFRRRDGQLSGGRLWRAASGRRGRSGARGGGRIRIVGRPAVPDRSGRPSRRHDCGAE